MLTNREYLGITLPFMLSTMTQPLMGAVNTAVMGQLGDPKYIAAVSLGAILFNNLYWLFGFLRVSTTGYSAQALGADSMRLSLLAFFKPLVIALTVSFLCIIFQNPILNFYISMINPADDVAELCRVYYEILIWGAPLVLVNYVALGWLMGRTLVKISVFMQISMNVLNMALSIYFVFGLKQNIEGVAWATLISQIYGAVLGLGFVYFFGKLNYKELPVKELMDPRAFLDMLKVNANLVIRTACLLTVNNMIAAIGASFGTVVLAANAVLMQIKDIMSYLIDGMGNSMSIFSGKAYGQKSIQLFEATLKMSLKWLSVLVFFLIAVYYIADDKCIAFFTDSENVKILAREYKNFLLVFPLCSGVALLLYGGYTGTTFTAPIRNMMLIALSVFYVVQYFGVEAYGNAGLWTSVLAFYGTQSIVLWIFLGKLRKRISNIE